MSAGTTVVAAASALASSDEGGSQWTRAGAGVDPLRAWPAFAVAVRERLEAGRKAYGDASFERQPAELIGELQQEALDLAGWGFVLWCRLEAMRLAAQGDAR